MEMLSAEQIAEKWNVSTRTIQNFCRKGRIPGAVTFGKSWMIPADAEHPKDGRCKDTAAEEVAAPRIVMPVQSPLMIMSPFYNQPGSADQCTESLAAMPETQALFAGQLAFMQGDVTKALELILPLLDVDADFYGSMNIGMILMAIAAWQNDEKLWEKGRARMSSATCANDAQVEIRALWLSIANHAIPTKPQALDAASWTEFHKLPGDSIPLYLFYYAKYMHRVGIDVAREETHLPDVKGMGVLRMFPYLAEPLVAHVHGTGAVLPEIYLHLLCADAHNKLGKKDRSEQHLAAAVSLCLPDKLYGILAEYRGLMSNALDECLERKDRAAAREIRRLEKKMYTNWMKMMRESEDFGLSDRQKEIARLISIGLSNDEIADRLGISSGTVKSYVTEILNKTGSSKRDELGSHIF